MASSSDQDVLSAAKQVLNTTQKEALQVMKLKQELDPGGYCLAIKKSQFSELKHGLLDLTARMEFLRNLKGDPSYWPSPSDSDKHLESLTAELNDTKEENSDIKDKINQLSEKAEEALIQFENKKEQLENKRDELEKAMQKLEEAKQKKITSKQDQQKECQQQLDSKKAKLAALQKLITSSEENLEKKKKVIDNLRTQNTVNSEAIAMRRNNRLIQRQPLFNRHEWATSSLTHMYGSKLQIQYSDNTKLIMEFQGECPEKERSTSLFINLQFKRTRDGHGTITNAMVNDDSFPINNILEAERNDIPSFIRKVVERWQSSRALPLHHSA